MSKTGWQPVNRVSALGQFAEARAIDRSAKAEEPEDNGQMSLLSEPRVPLKPEDATYIELEISRSVDRLGVPLPVILKWRGSVIGLRLKHTEVRGEADPSLLGHIKLDDPPLGPMATDVSAMERISKACGWSANLICASVRNGVIPRAVAAAISDESRMRKANGGRGIPSPRPYEERPK